MGWCGVGDVIRESIDLSEYPSGFHTGFSVWRGGKSRGGGGGGISI